ncbi:MAG: hypothetical protein B7Z26_01970 [Asticcacaulis sp. 32-58-5]|nr:MAG: hypothetical protein B7Z26_01970 [Asticcacaulis sp. 32-58-5]
MDWIWENADKIGGLGGAISSIIALIAVVFAVQQIKVSRSTAHEINAIQVYQEYLKACVERPKLGCWEIFAQYYEYEAPAELFDSDEYDENVEAYLWFVSQMLQMCELVLASPHSKELEMSLKVQIGWHKETIIELWERKSWAESYSKKLRELVAEEIQSLKKFAK